MSSKHPNKKKSSQVKASKVSKSSKLWTNLDEKNEENINGGCYPGCGRGGYYYYYYY